MCLPPSFHSVFFLRSVNLFLVWTHVSLHLPFSVFMSCLCSGPPIGQGCPRTGQVKPAGLFRPLINFATTPTAHHANNSCHLPPRPALLEGLPRHPKRLSLESISPHPRMPTGAYAIHERTSALSHEARSPACVCLSKSALDAKNYVIGDKNQLPDTT